MVVCTNVSACQADLRCGKRSQTALKVSGNRVDVLVNNAGMYYPMSLEEGPNKGQGPLDGATRSYTVHAVV